MFETGKPWYTCYNIIIVYRYNNFLFKNQNSYIRLQSIKAVIPQRTLHINYVMYRRKYSETLYYYFFYKMTIIYIPTMNLHY